MQTVNITIDGKVYSVPAGTTDLKALVKQLALHPLTTQLSVSSRPSTSTTINGNDSITLTGGEVFTSVHG